MEDKRKAITTGPIEVFSPTMILKFEQGFLMQLWQGDLGTQEWRKVRGQ